MLIVGLGNPGPEYADHRHNVGFMVLDRLNEVLSATWTEKKPYAQSRARFDRTTLTLLKPYTFMNRSGQVVAERARFFGVAAEELLVVHDDIDLPLGTIRIKKGGGTAGHNGLRSIAASLGTPDFPRIRVGIGRPEYKDQVRSYVLSSFDRSDEEHLDTIVDGAVEACKSIITDGLRAAQNAIHGREFLANLPL